MTLALQVRADTFVVRLEVVDQPPRVFRLPDPCQRQDGMVGGRVGGVPEQGEDQAEPAGVLLELRPGAAEGVREVRCVDLVDVQVVSAAASCARASSVGIFGSCVSVKYRSAGNSPILTRAST